MNIRDIRLDGEKRKAKLRDDVDESVASEIFNLREYRKAEKEIKNAASLIVDAGAHVGLFSIYCRMLNSDVKIVSLEPEPNNFKLLCENISLNNYANILPVKKALAQMSGNGLMLLSRDNHNHRLLRDDETPTGRTIKVNKISIADLVEELAAKMIDLLKLDIEGGEFEIIKSFAKKDFGRIGSIILEFHENQQNRRAILEDALRTNGFSVETFLSKFDQNLGFIFARNKRL